MTSGGIWYISHVPFVPSGEIAIQHFSTLRLFLDLPVADSASWLALLKNQLRGLVVTDALGDTVMSRPEISLPGFSEPAADEDQGAGVDLHRLLKDYYTFVEKFLLLLMDQKFVSGLGNIYVNEILFFSGVNPEKQIQDLSDSKIKNIIKFTKKILSKAIDLGGSSIKDFSSSSGKKGSYQQYFSVYGKKGENCEKKKCNGNIIKIILSNRASFYCPKCQK